MTPLSTLLLMAFAALAVGAAAYLQAPALARAWERLSAFVRSRSPWFDRALAPGLVAAAALGYALFLSRITLAQHRGLGTHVADLGYYDNLLYQSSHGHFLGCSFFPSGTHGTAHFDPILVVLSPLHRLHPGAEGLLVFQSVWLASGVVPLYLLSKRVLGPKPLATGTDANASSGRAPAAVIALAYLFHPALAGANAYDFHSLTLVVVPLLWMAWAFESGRDPLYYLALAAALLCREDVALLCGFVGISMALSKRPGARRRGLVTLAVSLAWFGVVKTVFMPPADATELGKLVRTFAHYYEELLPEGGGPVRLLVNVVTHPLLALAVILREAKAVFVLQIFLPLAFLPFAVKRGRLALLYGLALSLLASKPAVFDIHHQYPCTLLPVAFALTPYALRRLRGRSPLPSRSPRLFTGALAALVTASLLVGCAFGVFFPNASFRAGATPLVRTLTADQETTFTWVREQAARIPEQDSVGTSMTLGPHVSSRMRVSFYPDRLDVDWVFIDESETVGENLGAHHRAVRSGDLVEIARRGKLVLYRRRGVI